MCRKSDPESKGKIESVIKYIKNNFAKYRIYYGLDTWNEESWRWLERTGNYKHHNTTKKRPVEVFNIEKHHLRPVSYPRSEEHTSELQSRGHLVCRLLLEKKKLQKSDVPV